MRPGKKERVGELEPSGVYYRRMYTFSLCFRASAAGVGLRRSTART